MIVIMMGVSDNIMAPPRKAEAPPRKVEAPAGPGSRATQVWDGLQVRGTLGPRSLTEVLCGNSSWGRSRTWEAEAERSAPEEGILSG